MSLEYNVSPKNKYVLYVEDKGYWCSSNKMHKGTKYPYFSKEVTNKTTLYKELYIAKKRKKELEKTLLKNVQILWFDIDSNLIKIEEENMKLLEETSQREKVINKLITKNNELSKEAHHMYEQAKISLNDKDFEKTKELLTEILKLQRVVQEVRDSAMDVQLVFDKKEEERKQYGKEE